MAPPRVNVRYRWNMSRGLEPQFWRAMGLELHTISRAQFREVLMLLARVYFPMLEERIRLGHGTDDVFLFGRGAQFRDEVNNAVAEELFTEAVWNRFGDITPITGRPTLRIRTLGRPVLPPLAALRLLLQLHLSHLPLHLLHLPHLPLRLLHLLLGPARLFLYLPWPPPPPAVPALTTPASLLAAFTPVNGHAPGPTPPGPNGTAYPPGWDGPNGPAPLSGIAKCTPEHAETTADDVLPTPPLSESSRKRSRHDSASDSDSKSGKGSPVSAAKKRRVSSVKPGTISGRVSKASSRQVSRSSARSIVQVLAEPVAEPVGLNVSIPMDCSSDESGDEVNTPELKVQKKAWTAKMRSYLSGFGSKP
ncbi:uncharacterized protein N7515_005043 [Penicillium bovifimosum]|uniref:Uncharacterized protein n=1 Tax=Penicillium bovifimosum TaxID=126998 RepID=A0A9W9L2Z6_9EURO|nr:uncharacterized protein N7515_005043 [Penicillium bovifimosum]KAJ5135765.1 hypothetical protein N7515_005043 [Penicillium bovifimosum]